MIVRECIKQLNSLLDNPHTSSIGEEQKEALRLAVAMLKSQSNYPLSMDVTVNIIDNDNEQRPDKLEGY